MKPKRVQGADLSKLERYPLEGTLIRVLDGDTIELRKGTERINVRLAGIDAPETAKSGKPGQAGAGGSIGYLTAIINKYRSNLELWISPGAKTHGRLVGILVVGSLNINLAMVRRGLTTSYAPGQGADAGIQMGAFRAAEKQALAARQGIFALAQYRAQFALNRARGDVANVQTTDPARLANSFSARVRARAIDGLRQEDHSRNVPHAIQGMKPGRGDFGGGRTPGNPLSGLVTQQMVQGALGPDYGAWREAVQYLSGMSGGTGGFQFADIETLGLRATDPIIEASYSRITAMGAKHYNWAINPRLPTTANPDDLLIGMSTAYESAQNEAVRKRLMYAGSSTISAIPSEDVARLIPGGRAGDPLTFAHVEEMLGASKFSAAPQQLQAMRGLVAGGRTSDMSDILSFMFGEKAPGRQFMFIQNPRFEASKWAPHMSDTGFAQMLESGQLAAGDVGYKSIYQHFDVKMAKYSTEAFAIERAGGTGAPRQAAGKRTEWYRRLRSLIRTGGGRGTATVDIQDLTRSVFGMAGLLDEKAAMSMSGLMSQDVVGQILGLGAEAHVALPDQLQSQVVVAKLFQMGDAFSDALAKGNPSAAAHQLDRIKRVAHTQRAMGMFSVFKDLGQRVQHMSNLGIPEERMMATWKGTDMMELKRKGDFYYMAGEKIPIADAPKVLYAGGAVEELSLQRYGARRLATAVPGITEEQAGRMSRELIGMSIKSPDLVNRYATGDMYALITRGMQDPSRAFGGEPLERLGARLAAFEGTDPRDYPIEKHFEYMQRQLREQMTKQGRAAAEMTSTATGKTTKEALSAIGETFNNIPASAARWWDALAPGTRKGLGVAGAGVAVLGSLGIIGGAFEEEEQAVPESVDVEGYFAAQQSVDALTYLNESVDLNSMMATAHQTSGSMMSARKDPGRYYGSRL